MIVPLNAVENENRLKECNYQPQFKSFLFENIYFYIDNSVSKLKEL
jgi:hypothetical protein